MKIKNKKNIYRGFFNIILIFVITCLILSTFQNGEFLISDAKAEQEGIIWTAKIRIESSDGAGNELIFGEASDAEDGQDSYDAPAPPVPPQLPNINAKFITGMDSLYSSLLHEYKQYPDNEKTWNMSLTWLSEPGNTSLAEITISWNINELAESEYKTIILKDNNKTLSNMLTDNSYVYESESEVANTFMIVCSDGSLDDIGDDDDDNDIVDNGNKNETNNTGDGSNNTPGFTALSIIIVVFIMILYMRKKRF